MHNIISFRFYIFMKMISYLCIILLFLYFLNYNLIIYRIKEWLLSIYLLPFTHTGCALIFDVLLCPFGFFSIRLYQDYNLNDLIYFFIRWSNYLWSLCIWEYRICFWVCSRILLILHLHVWRYLPHHGILHVWLSFLLRSSHMTWNRISYKELFNL